MSELRRLLMSEKDTSMLFHRMLNYIIYSGERDLSYRVIITTHSVLPFMGLELLRHVPNIRRFCLFAEGVDGTDELVSSAISIVNNNLRLGVAGAGACIPRERGHKELYDRFVRDWFGSALVTNGMRQEYRYIVGETRKGGSRSFCDMGSYFRAGLAADFDDRRWSYLLGLVPFVSFVGCVPVVDIDIEIQKETLYHALGLALLVASKSGAWRVLLVSARPIWVDLTEAKGSFCAMTRLLWEHCEIRVPSRFSESLTVMSRAISSGYGDPLRLVIFSERFLFNWFEWVPRLGSVIFWNIGIRASVPVDFYLDEYAGLTLMSGYGLYSISSVGSSMGSSMGSRGVVYS